MQDREEDRAFDRELEATLAEQLLNTLLAAAVTPQSLEDQHRPELMDAQRRHLTTAVRRQQQDLVGKSCSGSEQGIELAALLQHVEPSESDQHALPRPALLPEVLDNLQIGA